MEYNINKGIGRNVEFNGLQAQYLYFFVGGLLAIFLLFVIFYMIGIDRWFCIGFGVLSAFSLLYYRKKERRTVAATMRKTQAPNQLPAVLPVSGSPLLNFEYTLMAPISPTIAPAAYINLVAGSK